MKTIEILQTIMAKMPDISQPMRKFLVHLVQVFLSAKGRYNFTNLGCWGELCERTFRRNYDKAFDFRHFSVVLIDLFLDNHSWIAVSDCSYVAKSGKKTYGLDRYWSGCARKAIKGLEVSALALVSVNNGLALTLSVNQTPSGLKDETNRLLFYCAAAAYNS
ncbi:MAG: hypothetical protein AAF944_09410 [Bacteroidota bacterium]